jgi:hypothetical protein
MPSSGGIPIHIRIKTTGEMRMAGATHLQNRLDREDVKHIFALRTEGVASGEIARRYRLSSSSMSRILSGNWGGQLVSAWGSPSHYMTKGETGNDSRDRVRLVCNNLNIPMSKLDTLLEDRKAIEEMLRENGLEIIKALKLSE